MVVNINLKVTSFGQLIFEIGKPFSLFLEPPRIPVHEEIRYREPLETASRIYEVQYEQGIRTYIVPFSTA
ncbi:MAG: hypothetical protein ONB05_04885 [candidate division KSB1 bacterium]|nr:hypothetical protein [candidate division KSB1 bacterium]